MTQPLNPATLQDMAEDLGVEPLVPERDWVLTEIIYHLAQQPIGQDLVLKGGQALRHVYGSDRFSKDADYVARRRVDFADLRDLLTIRYPRLRPPLEPPQSTKFGLTIDPIAYTGPLRVPGAVEVEVSFREDIQRPAPMMHYISPFREPFQVAVMDLHEMIAEKVRAMAQRGNPRDLYDLWFIFSRIDISISVEIVAQLIPHLCGAGRARHHSRPGHRAGLVARDTVRSGSLPGAGCGSDGRSVRLDVQQGAHRAH